MTTDKQIETLNWYNFLGKIKVILEKFTKKEDGVNGTFTVGGYIYTIQNGQITSKVLE